MYISANFGHPFFVFFLVFPWISLFPRPFCAPQISANFGHPKFRLISDTYLSALCQNLPEFWRHISVPLRTCQNSGGTFQYLSESVSHMRILVTLQSPFPFIVALTKLLTFSLKPFFVEPSHKVLFISSVLVSKLFITVTLRRAYATS